MYSQCPLFSNQISAFIKSIGVKCLLGIGTSLHLKCIWSCKHWLFWIRFRSRVLRKSNYDWYLCPPSSHYLPCLCQRIKYNLFSFLDILTCYNVLLLVLFSSLLKFIGLLHCFFTSIVLILWVRAVLRAVCHFAHAPRHWSEAKCSGRNGSVTPVRERL
jgi:hypothetical protein